MKTAVGVLLLSVAIASAYKFRSACPVPLMYSPVCGSDGKTYDNRYALECQQKADKDLRVAYKGACQETTMEASNSEESLGCACPRINNPVCGSNGITYGNSCELKCQQQVNPGLTKASKGECQEKTVCACPRILRPVCGTDGQTYSNKCLLDCKTKKNPDVKMSYNGNCRGLSQPQVDPMPQPQVYPMPQPQVDPMPQPQIQTDPLPQNDAQSNQAVCPCPRILRPVCGTDGQTYSNKCLLDCQTKKNPDVKLSYNGNCRARSEPQLDPIPQTQVDSMQQPQTDPMPMRPFVCPCPKMLRPVCGTDGETYSNQCLLNCQAKKNPDLKKSYDGPCEDNTEQELERGDECICPMNYAPVCGSDGQTYSNKCTLLCQNTKDRDLSYEHNGPCRPKDGSSPDVMY